MSVVIVPFERVEVDIMRHPPPIHISYHQSILVLVEYTTQYYEAIPLQNTWAPKMARGTDCTLFLGGISKTVCDGLCGQFHERGFDSNVSSLRQKVHGRKRQGLSAVATLFYVCSRGAAPSLDQMFAV